MTSPFIDRCARVRGAKLALAALGLALAGCSAAPGEPPPPSDVLDLYAATYGALPGTGAAPYAMPSPVSDASPDDAASSAPEATAPADAGVPPPPADEVAALTPAEDIAAPAVKPAVEPAVEPAGASATPEPPEIDATPSDLFGLDEAGIAALLGPPHYARNEPPARVLQYAALTCVLDLFLYPEGPDGTMATVYFEMRPTGDAPTSSGCFTGLVLAARGY